MFLDEINYQKNIYESFFYNIVFILNCLFWGTNIRYYILERNLFNVIFVRSLYQLREIHSIKKNYNKESKLKGTNNLKKKVLEKKCW